MCDDRKTFAELCNTERPQEVTLGDGHELETVGQGIVRLKLKLSNGKMKKCRLDDVLYVPTLSYNLISVSKAAEAGKSVTFREGRCQILNAGRNLIAVGSRQGICTI